MNEKENEYILNENILRSLIQEISQYTIGVIEWNGEFEKLHEDKIFDKLKKQKEFWEKIASYAIVELFNELPRKKLESRMKSIAINEVDCNKFIAEYTTFSGTIYKFNICRKNKNYKHIKLLSISEVITNKC